MPALLRVVPVAQQIEEQQREAAMAAQNQEVILNLASYVESCWQSAYIAKQPIERRMLRSIRQREGQYEPDELARIRQQGGSEIFMLLTQAKCRAAEAWIRDVLLQQGENPWGIDPTPIADLPPIAQEIVTRTVQLAFMARGIVPTRQQWDEAWQIFEDRTRKAYQQLAKRAAQGMERKIDDQLKEGGWKGAFSALLFDFTTNLAAILKGPVIRRRAQLKWGPQPDGMWVPIVGTGLVLEFYRVNPFDLYPSAGCRNVQDGYLIERHRMHRRNLTALIGVPGYDETAIRAALDEFGRGGLRNWMFNDQARADVEGRPNEFIDPHGTIDALQFSGSVQGKWLIEWGAAGRIDPEQEYEADIWKIGRFVIRAALNPHLLGKRLYHKACWEEMPDNFWGAKSLPEILDDPQSMCNAAGRALSNNMALSSGPQVETNIDRIPPGQDVHGMWPWKNWQVTSSKAGTTEPAVRFHDVPSNAQELMAVFEKFERVADNVSGVPAYTYGDSQQSGAGRTASGLSMLMSSAARGVKMGIARLDEGIVEPAVTELYTYNMLHDPDPSIKGDLKVVAKGATALIVKEQQQIRRTEFMQATANPVDAQIMGPAGRAELLRDTAKSLDLDAEKIVPAKEELELQQAGAAAAAGAVPPGNAQARPGQTLDAAGNPAGGQDHALFNQ